MTSRQAMGFAPLLCAFAVAAHAQELRGTVRDSASHQPIPAAVLLLLDSAGATLGRNITNEHGVYRIALSPGMRRLRVVRIGFRPREAPIPRVVNGMALLDVAMQSLPTMLEAVRVTDSTTCPARPDRAAALALWEQARAGLLATIVARASQSVAMSRLMFDRLFLRNSDAIVYQRVRFDSTNASTSFNAAHTAAEFVANGFMEDKDGDQLFFAPDADVLVDDAFARGYCFRLVSPPRERPRTQLGLSFNAAAARSGRIDIDGTLWVDTAQRAIRDIEFKYVGLDRALDRLRPGGHVSFQEAKNGIVFVDRWGLRFIAAAPTGLLPTSPIVARAAVGISRDQRVFVQEVGGEVARAAWPGGTVWHASLGTFRGRVAQEKIPVGAGVLVRLRGTDYSAHTDSAGRFEIPRLLPGPYEVDLAEPAFEKFNLVQDSSTSIVAARDSVIDGRVAMATVDDYIHDACPRRGGVVRHSILIVRALDAGLRPVRDLRIALTSAPTRLGPWTSMTAHVPITGGTGQLIMCETRAQKPLPTDGVIRVVSIDPKFGSDAVYVDVDPEARLLTTLLYVNPRP